MRAFGTFYQAPMKKKGAQWSNASSAPREGSHFEIASFQVMRYNCTHEERQRP